MNKILYLCNIGHCCLLKMLKVLYYFCHTAVTDTVYERFSNKKKAQHFLIINIALMEIKNMYINLF